MRVLAPALVATLTLLAGCGTTEPPASPDNGEGSGGSPVTVTDARGTTVTLKSAATKVVVLEWGEAEMVATLGVMPVGVADPEGYRVWDAAAPLDGSVKNVGTRQEPSVDAIVGLAPDVVIMPADRDSVLVPQLEKHVPVVVTKSSDASRNMARLREDFTLIARTIGRSAEADRILADMDATLAESRKAVASAGASGHPFVMADGYQQGSTISIRPFGKGSLVSDVAEGVGLKNAWSGPVDEQWGLGQTDVEGLAAITDPSTRLFYSASKEDVFTTGLAKNPIWQRLPFVASKKVTKFEPGTWTFGGPRSVTRIAEQVVKATTA